MTLEKALVNRSKAEYECKLGPKLILIAEKPLTNDKYEIFDSLPGICYLSKCFESKYKAVDTHVTYVNDETNTHFARNILFKILEKYRAKGTLRFEEVVIGFAGQSAFDAFKADYSKTTDVSTLQLWINEESNALQIFSVSLGLKDDIVIPYKILPEVTDDLSDLPETLNIVQEMMPGSNKSIYCYTDQLITKLNFIQTLHAEGSLAGFKFGGKVTLSKEGKKTIEYMTIYDKFTNVELIYCHTDVVCKDDTPEQKHLQRETIRKTLTSVPIYGEDLDELLSIIPYRTEIKVLSEEEAKFEIANRKSFVEIKENKLADSAWYSKWYKEAFIPNIKPNLNKVICTREGYDLSRRSEWVYDIEVFKEDWLFVAKTLDKKNKVVCWNDGDSLRAWVKDKILIGFNNAAYDDPVIKHAMTHEHSVETDTPTVKQFSDGKINDDPSIKNHYKLAPGIKSPNFLSWDINFHMPFDIRRNSLKKLTMSVLNKRNYDSDVPFDIDRILTTKEREDVEKYCELDVDNTLELFLPDPADIEAQKTNPKHKFRTFAQESYDIKWNLIVTYNMRAKTLINKSSSFAGKLLCGEDAKPSPTNTYKMVKGKKQYYAIPELALKELAGTELLQFYLDNQDNPGYLTEKYEHFLGGTDEGHKYQFGFGGLHQALLKYGSRDLINMDVASLYPSLLVHYGLMSRGASAKPESYEEVYKTRLAAKRDGLKLLNEGLKLILNGAIGAMLSRFNPLYDTWANSSVCVHGQLLLYILVKRLYDAGFNIVQTNTDGIMIERQGDVEYMDICTKWEEETNLILEYDEIDILQQNNVNNYYCQFKGGYVKSKGFYLSNEKFGKATSKILCNLVVGEDPLSGCAARDFVIFKRHSIGEIYDAVTRTKLEGRSLAFVLGKEDDPRTQAYYSRSRNQRVVQVKDDKGKYVLDENGEKVTEIINSESTITGFNEHMLLVDDINELTMDEINTEGYVVFAKNLLSKDEVFGPYYNENLMKFDEPNMLQALNSFKDHGDLYPTNAGVVCQNFLFECDYLTKEEQLEMINACKDKLYRVVWSGSKSFHCVVRIDRPISSVGYKRVWHYLKNTLGLLGADEQCSIPSKYTRVPGQVNAKTGNMQELYYEDNNVLSYDEILEAMPKIKESQPTTAKFTGKRTYDALKRHIKRQEWVDGSRFTAVQKLSPILISLVTLEELLDMIPVKLDRDHIAVLRSKYYYFEKYEAEQYENVDTAENHGLEVAPAEERTKFEGGSMQEYIASLNNSK